MLNNFQSLAWQGQPKPLFHAKARLHFLELSNGLFCCSLVFKVILFDSFYYVLSAVLR